MEELKTYNQATVTSYRIQTKNHEGKKYLIVPVVMMVEGVHSGSHGAVLHTAAELGRFPAAWNGIPVTIGHPQDTGGYVSANSPQIIERYAVGKIYNARMEANKLKAEVWVEEAKITTTSPVALAYIRQGRPLEVSIGAFTEEDVVTGTYNGENYVAIARNHRPDHLALLPGETGACSWTDGCGIRANSNQKSSNLILNANEKMNDEEILAEKDRLQARINSNLSVNAVGLRERLDAVRNVVDGWDNTRAVHYMEEVYDGYFVFRRSTRNPNGPSTEQGYFQQHYTMVGNVIQLVGDEKPVTKSVSYTPIQANQEIETESLVRTKHPVKMEKKTPCFLAKVEKLINNSASPFTEANKEWLLTQEEQILDMLMPREVAPEAAPEVNAAKAVDIIRTAMKTPEDFINLAPAEMQDQMRSGLRLHKAHRDGLVKTIMANAQKDSFTEAELLTMETGMLEKIKASLPVPVDYSANGGGGTPINTNSGAPLLLPPGVKETPAK